MSKVYSNKALPPGTVLREWRLEQVLGVGGFGIVYKGRGIYFDELVAIKEYFPSAISDRKDGDTVVPNDSASEEVHALGLKKFVEEAKLLWNLSKPTRHPNIVSVRSLFEIHGTAYMVMDFEDGVPLSDLIKKRKKFSEAGLMELIRPIAEGLDRAHRVGVLHRDIKPGNILVGEDGTPVLIDFGSARFDTAEATSTKVTFHTPPYAAIEQYVKTYEQGPWTDIYALGVVLYECVTGAKPPEVLERMHGGLGHPLAEGDWPDFSRAFLRAIDAAMIIRPTDRPQSIPQWLALFDDENAPIGAAAEDSEEAPTRFAAFEAEEIVPVVPAPTLSSSGAAVIKLKEPPAKDGAGDEAPARKRKRKGKAADADEAAAGMAAEEPAEAPPAKRPIDARRAAVIGGLLLASAAGGAWLLWPGSGGGALDPGSELSLDSADSSEALQPQNAALSPTENAAEPVAGPVDLSRIDALSPAIASLAGAARGAGRGGDAGRLAAASARLRSLAAEAKAAAAQPGQEATVKAKVDQMNGLAMSAGRSLTQAVLREANTKSSDLARVLPWANPNGSGSAGGQPADRRAAVAALRGAMSDIKRASSAASRAATPNQAIEAARRSLSASRQFAATYPKVYGFVLPAKRDEFNAIASLARATGAKVTEMASAKKPGLFASKKRRDDFRLRQQNGAAAQAELARLNELSGAVAAITSASSADNAITQATAIRVKLEQLRASSTAAMPGKDEEETPQQPRE